MNFLKSMSLKHVQVMLSAMAMILCLYAASSLHQHESGYHALQSDCVICDIESLVTHGVTASYVNIETPDFVSTPYLSDSPKLINASISLAYAVRAPPFFS